MYVLINPSSALMPVRLMINPMIIPSAMPSSTLTVRLIFFTSLIIASFVAKFGVKLVYRYRAV